MSKTRTVIKSIVVMFIVLYKYHLGCILLHSNTKIVLIIPIIFAPKMIIITDIGVIIWTFNIIAEVYIFGRNIIRLLKI